MSPRVRRGPNGPKRSIAGKSGTNKSAKAPKGSSGSGTGHLSQLAKGAQKPKGY